MRRSREHTVPQNVAFSNVYLYRPKSDAPEKGSSLITMKNAAAAAYKVNDPKLLRWLDEGYYA